MIRGKTMYHYRAVLSGTGIPRTTDFFSMVEPDDMTKQRAVGMLGRSEVKGEYIINVYCVGQDDKVV
jgi:hypothetical protein